jgi:hypothetical protein
MQSLQKQRAHKQLSAADFLGAADERGGPWGLLLFLLYKESRRNLDYEK